VGDYKLKSAVATAWCRLAGRGDKNAGAAVEGLRRAARERALQREEAQHEQFRVTLADTARLDNLTVRLCIQATREDGSTVSLDWRELSVTEAHGGLYLGAAYDPGMLDFEADRLCRQAPTPGGVSPASAQFFAWMRELATKSQEEATAATQNPSLQASVTVRRGAAVVEVARFGARGTPYGGSGVHVLYVAEHNRVMPLILNLHYRPGEFPLAVPRAWTLLGGYDFARASVGFSILCERGSGEPKCCRLDMHEAVEGAPFREMAGVESARILNALLDAELVRAARE
jgi:hypothetical protein